MSLSYTSHSEHLFVKVYLAPIPVGPPHSPSASLTGASCSFTTIHDHHPHLARVMHEDHVDVTPLSYGQKAADEHLSAPASLFILFQSASLHVLAHSTLSLYCGASALLTVSYPAAAAGSCKRQECTTNGQAHANDRFVFLHASSHPQQEADR